MKGGYQRIQGPFSFFAGQNIVSNSVKMDHFKQRQNATITVLIFTFLGEGWLTSLRRNIYCFSHCSFKYCLKQCHNARLSVLVFKIFSAVPNRFKYPQNAIFTALVFIFFLCSSKLFQIPSECNIYRPCFHFILCFSKLFQILPQCMLQRHWFHFFSLQFQIISNTIRMQHLPSLFSFYSLHF